jgi:hypothetical protein
MKKFLLLLIVVVFSLTQLRAQTFKTGDMAGILGVGLGWYKYDHKSTASPAFSLSIEKGIKDLENNAVLSIGGIVGFKHATYAWHPDYTWTFNDIIIAARGAIHYDIFKESKIDTYGGMALGLRIRSETIYYYDTDEPYGIIKSTPTHYNPLFALYVGGLYYFDDKLAAFGELGYGLGYLTIGLRYTL